MSLDDISRGCCECFSGQFDVCHAHETPIAMGQATLDVNAVLQAFEVPTQKMVASPAERMSGQLEVMMIASVVGATPALQVPTVRPVYILMLTSY